MRPPRTWKPSRKPIDGWAGPLQVHRIKGKKITIVPILRAGLGMLPGVLDMIPSAKVSVVGVQRDEETLQPVAYYEKLSGRHGRAHRADRRPDAGHRRHAGRRRRHAEGGRLQADQGPVPGRCARRPEAHRGRPSGYRDLHRRRSTNTSTSTATSCPVWAMPATRSSAPKQLASNGIDADPRDCCPQRFSACRSCRDGSNHLPKRSVASINWCMMPGSNAEWPASCTMCRSASGHARCRSQALRSGHTTS